MHQAAGCSQCCDCFAIIRQQRRQARTPARSAAPARLRALQTPVGGTGHGHGCERLGRGAARRRCAASHGTLHMRLTPREKLCACTRGTLADDFFTSARQAKSCWRRRIDCRICDKWFQRNEALIVQIMRLEPDPRFKPWPWSR